jgi:type IV pilus assembly protein PilY1
MYNSKRIIALLAGAMMASSVALAEDIDIFLQNPNLPQQRPNVLLVIDNAASNNSQITQLCGGNGDKLAMIRQVLRLLIDPTNSTFCPTDLTAAQKADLLNIVRSINLGLMIFNPSGSSKGGYVRYHVRSMDSQANRLALLSRLSAGGQPLTTTSDNPADVAACVGGVMTSGAFAGNPCTVNPGGTTTTPAQSFEFCGNCTGNTLRDYPAGSTCTNITLISDASGSCGSSRKGHRIDVPAETTTIPTTVTIVTGVSEGTGIPQANNAPYAKSMHEAYLYFGGKAAYVGFESGEYDPGARDGVNYRSPAGDACQKNYIVFIGNGGPDAGEDNDAQALLTGIGGKLPTDPMPITPSNYARNWFDEYGRTLNKQDVVPALTGTQNVITYSIAVHNPADPNDDTNPMKSARALLKNGADKGGGRYFDASSAQKFLEAMKTIFQEVQAVNSVFASVTLPVSVNVRGTNLNQVYMGVFRPDKDALPRWYGNLKEYQLAFDAATNEVFLADSNGLNITSPTTGFVVDDAVSFWTSPSNYWGWNPDISNPSDSPDGPLVEKGGAGQRLRQLFPGDATGRRVFTCIGCTTSTTALSASSGASTSFDVNNSLITQAILNVTSAIERTNLITWVRGEDVLDENSNSVVVEPRPTIHADVLHSRPAVINYNRDGTDNDVVVFYGSNDGLLHAVKGGQGASDGGEKWAFVAEEFLGRLKRSFDNSPAISTSSRKTYYFDGPIASYQLDANGDGKLLAGDGDKVHIFAAMRRGGRFIYAFDVTDPDNPKFLWKKGCPNLDNNTGCSAGYEELGQSWSEPQVTHIWSGTDPATRTKRPVLAFGAGYDPAADDAAPGTAVTRTKGRGIFVVDASTGDVIWRAGPSGTSPNLVVSGMDFSIPSDLAVLERTREGAVDEVADRFYAGDTRGNVWRVSLVDPGDTSTWTVTKLASVGGAGASGARKFLFPASVVFAVDSAGNKFDAVLLGSGDREQPFDTTVTNRVYMFKDTDIGVAGTNLNITESELYDATVDVIGTGSQADANVAKTQLAAAKGWMVTLASGEKVVGSVLTVGGKSIFSTNQPAPPDPGTCASNLGIARIYSIDFLTAAQVPGESARFREVAGGGLLPSPVYARVRLLVDGKQVTKEATIIGTQPVKTHSIKPQQRKKIYWHKELEGAKKP